MTNEIVPFDHDIHTIEPETETVYNLIYDKEFNTLPIEDISYVNMNKYDAYNNKDESAIVLKK
ncbi:hypothetical protein [Bartonella harrusi]|uniref:Uncharacterized protein n=1 Tax=Bartonella harrusi TaxID=2961895 RepID=A0ABY5EVP6_9HYPH|nr:hypothetical protein [Bartonella harrusi]UTO28241.1 hypothetical protein NMK50_08850 [Bartonella harrusi]